MVAAKLNIFGRKPKFICVTDIFSSTPTCTVHLIQYIYIYCTGMCSTHTHNQFSSLLLYYVLFCIGSRRLSFQRPSQRGIINSSSCVPLLRMFFSIILCVVRSQWLKSSAQQVPEFATFLLQLCEYLLWSV